MRSESAPYQKFKFVVPPRCYPHALDISEQHVPERPVHYDANSVRVVMSDLANQRCEVSEVAGATFLVGGTFALRLEDFWEVFDDGSPDEKKPMTN